MVSEWNPLLSLSKQTKRNSYTMRSSNSSITRCSISANRSHPVSLRCRLNNHLRRRRRRLGSYQTWNRHRNKRRILIWTKRKSHRRVKMSSRWRRWRDNKERCKSRGRRIERVMRDKNDLRVSKWFRLCRSKSKSKPPQKKTQIPSPK